MPRSVTGNVRDMDERAGPNQCGERTARKWLEVTTLSVELHQRSRDAQARCLSGLAVRHQKHLSELGLTDADRIIEHSLKHWFERSRRRTNNFQHLRSGDLLLKRFSEIVRALAQLI